MPFILNINTAIDITYISLTKEGKLLSETIIEDQKSNATILHVKIKELITKNDLNINQLNAIAIVNGPGSYTGLRVGLATAKGICYALKIPLIAINTLELMASFAIVNNPKNNCLYCPMIDARRMEVFTALYNEDLKIVQAPHALILDSNSFSEEIKNRQIYFFGNGMLKWKNIFSNPNALFIDTSNYNQSLYDISYDKYRSSSFSDLQLLEPYYVKEFYSM